MLVCYWPNTITWIYRVVGRKLMMMLSRMSALNLSLLRYVTSIGSHAFRCTTSLHLSLFQICHKYWWLHLGCTNLASVTIPDSVELLNSRIPRMFQSQIHIHSFPCICLIHHSRSAAFNKYICLHLVHKNPNKLLFCLISTV